MIEEAVINALRPWLRALDERIEHINQWIQKRRSKLNSIMDRQSTSTDQAQDTPKKPKVRLFGPPSLPQTPSKTINNMLQTRCGKPQPNPVYAAVSYYICGVFQVIQLVYSQIRPDKTKESHTFWMISCAAVSAAIVIKSVLVYHIVVASAFAFHFVLYYTTIAFALLGVGLGISGMMFFDKDAGGKQANDSSKYY